MASAVRAAVGRASSLLSQVCYQSARPLLSLSRCLHTHPSPPTITTSKPSWSPSLSPFSPTSLLQLTQRFSPIAVTQRRSYHMRLSLKKRCSSCYFVRRKGRLFMECKSKPRHRAMQMMSKRKIWREDYSKGNIERAVHWKFSSEKLYYKLGDNKYARHDWLKGKIGVTV